MAVPPGGAIRTAPKRASAQAASGVSAIAAIGRKSLGREAGFDRRDQRRLAAEEMRGAGDVEQQPVGRIERRQRREAAAPVETMVEASQPRPADRLRPPAESGQMARASARPMPGRMARAAARRSTAAIRWAPLTLVTVTSG